MKAALYRLCETVVALGVIMVIAEAASWAHIYYHGWQNGRG